MGYYANEALLRFLYKAGKKWNWLWPLLAGALSFGISQLLLRIPILQYGLPRFDWFLLLPYRNPLLYGFLLAFTAGLFEETARWIGFRILGPNRRGFRDGVVFGLGHGGVEAVWVFWMMAAQLQAGIQATPLGLALGFAERAAAVCFHVGASVLVLYGVRKRKIRWLFLAILLHTLLDMTVVLGNIWIQEGLIWAAGAAFLGWTLFMRKRFSTESGTLPDSP